MSQSELEKKKKIQWNGSVKIYRGYEPKAYCEEAYNHHGIALSRSTHETIKKNYLAPLLQR